MVFLTFLNHCVRLSSAFIFGSIEIPEENGILILNQANFNKAVQDYEPLVVNFYLPWCKHCKNFAPEFTKIAKLLNAQNPKVCSAKIDAETEKTLARLYHVQGLPAIRLFINGQFLIYNGPRTAESVIAWVNKNCSL